MFDCIEHLTDILTVDELMKNGKIAFFRSHIIKKEKDAVSYEQKMMQTMYYENPA